jgi:hypothetical protein
MSTPKGHELLPALVDGPGRFAAEDPRLVAGDHVKVGFKTSPPPRGERRGLPEGEWMWLEVTAAVGCPVEFRPGEIYAVVRNSPDRPEGERETRPGRGRR